jgi:hypothetical protein
MIADALIAARQRGVDVRVVLDKSQDTDRSLEHYLQDGGIATRIDHKHHIMHDKFIVADTDTVETGSFNFTKSAEEHNAENVIVLHDPATAGRYQRQWEKLWQESDAEDNSQSAPPPPVANNVDYDALARETLDGPLLVIDRWWGVDYAKVGCRIPAFKTAGKSEATCDQESTESYNTFELELKTQFAASAECAGITVSSFGYPQNPKEPRPDISRPYWSFSINYEASEAVQPWQMLPPEGRDLPMMQAKGTPSEIATQVCTIIKGKGGAVVH